MKRGWVLGLLGLVACGGASGATNMAAPAEPTAQAGAASESPRVKAPTPAVALAEPIDRSQLLPDAEGIVVFEVSQMRRHDIRQLARAFLLELIDFDLARLDEACSLDPIAVVDRIVMSGSLATVGVLAAVEVSLPPSRLLDCLAEIHPEARAEEIAGHPVLMLRPRLWATEREGAVLLGGRRALQVALGDEEPPPGLDRELQAVLPAPPPGGVGEVLPMLSPRADRLIAVANRGRADGFMSIPRLSVTLFGDASFVAVKGQIEARTGRRQDPGEIKRSLRDELSRAFDSQLPGVDAAPLLRAVEEALVEQTGDELRFEGRTTEVALLQQLVDALARREIRREIEPRETPPPPVEAQIEPAVREAAAAATTDR